ncbi:MAG: DUF4139 domain-containing protein [Desulfovibrio sp.]|nr:DUF4139 domain-containing protein [Desulfovibrio sp.]
MKKQGHVIWNGPFLCLFLLALGVFVFSTSRAVASELSLVSPSAALLSQEGGVLRVHEEAKVSEHNGQSCLSLVLPAQAENLRIEVEGASIVQEESFPYPLQAVSGRARRACELADRLEAANVSLTLLKERLAIWNSVPKDLTCADIEAWDSKKLHVLETLLPKKNAVEREIRELKEELKKLPAQERLGKLVRVTLAEKVKAAHLPVNYSYTLKKCGWRAHYAFAIAPEKSKKRVVVRLMAQVWQESGMDWTGTEITLVTGTKGKLTPPALASWVLEASEVRGKGSSNFDTAYEDAAPMAMAPANARRAESHTAARQDTSGVYASWLLPARNLEQGESSMLICQKEWETPLLWLARPNISQGQVFLMARHEIAQGEVWPDGDAIFSVSGQETGRGRFSVRGPQVTLYFGYDPRVSLEVVQDKRKRGESGFLGRDKTWTWGWTYILHNNHSEPVHVRLERPEPQIVQDKISVHFEDNPKANVDSKKHIRFWEVDVAAGASQSISHGLTIKAPENLSFFPKAP